MTVQVRTLPVIVLVKFHFRVSTELCQQGKFVSYIQNNLTFHQTCVQHNNFVVLRTAENSFVFTIFDSGFINCTGLSKLDTIPEAIRYTKEIIFKGTAVIHAFKIDTITACGQYGESIRLSSIACVPKLSIDGAKDNFNYRITFNPEAFAGLTIRFPGHKGTLNIFSSGQMVIIGTNTYEDMLAVYHRGCSIISRCVSLDKK